MNKLAADVSKNSIKYGSIPFWSWNDKLEPDELRRQIRNMHDMEMRGFFMHARGGLETEYLSEEWYDCIKACIDEAKKLGMEAWAYDENGWPSGFAGGKLLEDPENHTVYLEHEFTETYPSKLDQVLAVYAFNADGEPIRTDAPIADCNKYLTVFKRTDSSYVDTMRDDITEKFIKETHVEYQKRLGSDFGNAMPGFFTDEPQYYRGKTPFSNHMDKWFNEEYGYSVLDAVPALFCDYKGSEKYRYDYHRMTNTKFTENFSKKIYDWAEANGVKITGHFIEEQSLSGQMICCGDIMRQYQYEHIPGMDYLGRALQSDLPPKQLGSVCAQLGRKEVLSEMFACCGWDVTPSELKHIAELQYASGVNIMCQHLYPYSIRGQRKRDYPAHYSEHNPWQEHLKSFDRYFNNLGYMLALGSEYADTLVIHPIHSAWLKFKRIDGRSVEQLDKDLVALSYLLSGNQITYHFGDEPIMADIASVEGNTLKVGLCEYNKIIIPACDTLDASTVKLIKQFIKNGGKVYTFRHHIPTHIDGIPADLSFLSECDDISDTEVFNKFKNGEQIIIDHPENVGEKDLRMMVRKTEYGRLIYIANLSNKEFRSLKINVSNAKRFAKLDIDTLELSPMYGRADGNNVEMLLELNGSESVILTEFEAPEMLPFSNIEKRATIKLNNDFKVLKLPENMLTLDRAAVSYDGTDYTEVRPLERIRDNLLRERYKGELWLSFPFKVTDVPTKLSVVTEPMNALKLYVNGNEVTIGNTAEIDPSFRKTDIASLIHTGENFITLKLDYYQRDYVYYVLYGGVSETLRNCLVFDTEIECPYLFGSFSIDAKADDFRWDTSTALRYTGGTEFTLVAQKNDIDIRNIVTDGYPFYCGKLSFSTKLNYKNGDPTLLHLTGRFATVDINVNGNDVGTLLFGEYFELDKYLTEGENTLTLTLCNAYRNLLGPHHNKQAEPMSVGPSSFSFENQWNGDRCDAFEPLYAFVRFGIDID